MSIDDMVHKDELYRVIGNAHKKRKQFQEATDSLGHKMYTVYNSICGYMITEIEGLDYKGLEAYQHKEASQLELGLGLPDISTKVEQVYDNEGKVRNIPIGTDLRFHTLYKG
ncbi:MAG: hypothetical protein KAS32_09790 [Candidatus Peribacteraceae bacterium]|nr:hypothetical protein [Candidatus Peribacteraceae bacterium]